MGQLMRGSTWVRQHIATFLEENLPDLIDQARTEWSLDGWKLPYPARYDSYDPLTMAAYPTVGSLVRRTNNWRRRDMIAAEEHYSAVYSIILFIWVRTPMRPEDEYREPDDYGNTLRLRDDELALLRTCLLGTPSLGSNGLIELNESTLSEDYLEPIKVSKESPFWLAGGTLSFDLKVAEQNHAERIGEVETVEVEVQKIME